MNWLGITEAVALVLVVLLLLPVALLGGRRRWLARQGGLFECSARLAPDARRGSGWALGVARYSGDNLEWFRAFSLAFRPKLIFPRSQVRVGEQRDPDRAESALLYEDQRILRLNLADGDSWELALSAASLTGLLSWLESAPPGTRYR